MCGRDVWEEVKKEGWQENVVKILVEEGLGEVWMKDLREARGMSEKVWQNEKKEQSEDVERKRMKKKKEMEVT